MTKPIIDLIIPAFNEEASIGLVLQAIPKEWVREILVCDNASTDQTAAVAAANGGRVLYQAQKGYGSACLKGLEYIAQQAVPPDIVVFLDGDYSDYPEELSMLVQPIVKHNMDVVIGSRALGEMESGAMMPQQVFGNWLATTLIRSIYGYRFTDLGPFRAVRYEALKAMNMEDPDFGWTVEMQVKAAKMGLRCTEIPVRYRRRKGVSKISGTIRGTILAGHKILWTIFKLI